MKSPENTTKKLLVAVFLLFLFPLIAFAGFSPLGEIDMEAAKKIIDDKNSRNNYKKNVDITFFVV